MRFAGGRVNSNLAQTWGEIRGPEGPWPAGDGPRPGACEADLQPEPPIIGPCRSPIRGTRRAAGETRRAVIRLPFSRLLSGPVNLHWHGGLGRGGPDDGGNDAAERRQRVGTVAVVEGGLRDGERRRILLRMQPASMAHPPRLSPTQHSKQRSEDLKCPDRMITGQPLHVSAIARALWVHSLHLAPFSLIFPAQ